MNAAFGYSLQITTFHQINSLCKCWNWFMTRVWLKLWAWSIFENILYIAFLNIERYRMYIECYNFRQNRILIFVSCLNYSRNLRMHGFWIFTTFKFAKNKFRHSTFKILKIILIEFNHSLNREILHRNLTITAPQSDYS